MLKPGALLVVYSSTQTAKYWNGKIGVVLEADDSDGVIWYSVLLRGGTKVLLSEKEIRPYSEARAVKKVVRAEKPKRKGGRQKCTF